MSFFGKYKQIFSRRSLALSLIIFIIGVFLVAQPSSAQTLGWLEDKAVGLLGSLISVYIYLAGRLLLWIISKLIDIAQFNDFINQSAITHAWVIIRDVCNMFFVVLMLVIAISTMLNYQKYHYKTLLPKLVAAAILINFSRTIVGLIVDVSQVVMMTFVSGFAAAAGGNFIEALKINKIMAINPNVSYQEGLKMWQLVAAYILGAGIITLSAITVGMMLVMLLARIIALWILTALSPFAFMGMAFPGISKYTDRWWNEFFKYVTIGPVLAFFLWLAMTIVGTMPESLTRAPAEGEAGLVNVGISAIGDANVLMNYLIAIALLLAGVYAAKESGVAGGSLGMQAVNWAKQKGTGALKGVAAWTAKKPFQAIGAGLGAIDAKWNLREKGYRLLARVPGLTKFGVLRAADVKARQQQAAEKEVKKLQFASPETWAMAGKIVAWTPAQKALKREAEKLMLPSEEHWGKRQKEEEQKWLETEAKNRGLTKLGLADVKGLIAADPKVVETAKMEAKSKLQKEMAQMVTDVIVLGQATGDRSVFGVAREAVEANPDLINNDFIKHEAEKTKNEMAIKFAQNNTLEAVVARSKPEKLQGLRLDQITDQILAATNDEQRRAMKKVKTSEPIVVNWEMNTAQGRGPSFIVNLINKGKGKVDSPTQEQLKNKDFALEFAKSLNPDKFALFLRECSNEKKEAFREPVTTINRDDYKYEDPDTKKTRYNDNLRRYMERAVVAGAKFEDVYEYNTDTKVFSDVGLNTFEESLTNKDNTEKAQMILEIKEGMITDNGYDNELAKNIVANTDTTTLEAMLRTAGRDAKKLGTIKVIVDAIYKPVAQSLADKDKLKELKDYLRGTPALRKWAPPPPPSPPRRRAGFV